MILTPGVIWPRVFVSLCGLAGADQVEKSVALRMLQVPIPVMRSICLTLSPASRRALRCLHLAEAFNSLSEAGSADPITSLATDSISASGTLLDSKGLNDVRSRA